MDASLPRPPVQVRLAVPVHEALLRLEAAERWIEQSGNEQCDPDLARFAVVSLVLAAQEWLAKVAAA